MDQNQSYILVPHYGDSGTKLVGVLQHLQSLLSCDATLADVHQVICQVQQEFGGQESLENVIQTLVGRSLEKQVAQRKHASVMLC